MLVTALLLVAWRDACAIILAQRSAPTPAALPPPAPGTAAPAPTGKIPTSLAPGDWRAQVEAFEAAWTPRRNFPTKLLLGADLGSSPP